MTNGVLDLGIRKYATYVGGTYITCMVTVENFENIPDRYYLKQNLYNIIFLKNNQVKKNRVKNLQACKDKQQKENRLYDFH